MTTIILFMRIMFFVSDFIYGRIDASKSWKSARLVLEYYTFNCVNFSNAMQNYTFSAENIFVYSFHGSDFFTRYLFSCVLPYNLTPPFIPESVFIGFMNFVNASVESKVMYRDIYGIMMGSHLGLAIVNLSFFYEKYQVDYTEGHRHYVRLWMARFVRFKMRLRLVFSLMHFIHCTRSFNSHVRRNSIVFFIFSVSWYRDRTQDFLHHTIGNHLSWNYIPGRKPLVLNR